MSDKEAITRGADPVRFDRPQDHRPRKSQMAMNNIPTRYTFATREIESREPNPMDAKLTNAARLAEYHAGLKALKPSNMVSVQEKLALQVAAEQSRPKIEAKYAELHPRDPKRRQLRSQYFRERLRATKAMEGRSPQEGSMYRPRSK